MPACQALFAVRGLRTISTRRSLRIARTRARLGLGVIRVLIVRLLSRRGLRIRRGRVRLGRRSGLRSREDARERKGNPADLLGVKVLRDRHAVGLAAQELALGGVCEYTTVSQLTTYTRFLPTLASLSLDNMVLGLEK